MVICRIDILSLGFFSFLFSQLDDMQFDDGFDLDDEMPSLVFNLNDNEFPTNITTDAVIFINWLEFA